MPLWGRQDNAANSDIAATMQFNKTTTRANQTSLYNNTTANAFIRNQIVGQFAVDPGEMAAMQTTSHPQHAGWVIRREGTGLRAGRVTYETLVAGGTYGIPDGSDDTLFPDYRITITTQPTSKTSNVASNQTFTVVATSVPTTTLAYQWQKQTGPSSWTNLTGAPGQYFNVTTATLTANNQTANGNVFRVIVSATGANSVTSSNATIKYVI